MNLQKEIIQDFPRRLNPFEIEFLTYEETHYFDNIDFFQQCYIEYLYGNTKTRHRLFDQYRLLKDNQLFNLSDWKLFLKEIENYLLERELYESLILFRETNKVFKKAGKTQLRYKFIIERDDLTNIKVYHIRKQRGLRLD
jgi:uncharacterized protein YnzC (UPF0291/DUF896 family)